MTFGVCDLPIDDFSLYATLMEPSIEEEELTAQRDAAVSLFQDLKEKIRVQAEAYEARTEAAEMARIETEIELEQLRMEENGIAICASSQVRTVTRGWLIGVVLGWSAAFVLGYSFSPVLGFMLVLPFVSAGVIGGLMYAQLGDKIRPLRRETREVGGDLGNKQEFLRQLQGRSDPGTSCTKSDADSCSPSLTRRVAEAVAGALLTSALEVTMSMATSMLDFGGGNGGAAGSWWGGSRPHKKTKEE